MTLNPYGPNIHIVTNSHKKIDVKNRLDALKTNFLLIEKPSFQSTNGK